MHDTLDKLPGSSSILVLIAKSVPKSAFAATKSGICWGRTFKDQQN